MGGEVVDLPLSFEAVGCELVGNGHDLGLGVCFCEYVGF